MNKLQINGTEIVCEVRGMAKLMPNIEALVIPNVTHLMQIADPRGVAKGVADFLMRHPLAHPAHAMV